MTRAAAFHPPDEHKPLSALLRELTRAPQDSLFLDDVIDHFGRRSFAALLFIFAIPNLLPLPPGSTTILGLPLVIIAPQLAIGMKNLWLPRALGRRSMPRQTLARAFDKVLPRLVRFERLLKPRVEWVFGPVGDRLIGAVCFLLAIVLILPIPLGNMLPALAIATLALGLTQRDGLVAILGYGLVTLSLGAIALGFGAVIAGARHLLQMFGA